MPAPSIADQANPIAVLAGLPPWFVTNRYVPYWVAFGEVAWFAVGLVPPLAASGLFLRWRRRARQREPR